MDRVRDLTWNSVRAIRYSLISNGYEVYHTIAGVLYSLPIMVLLNAFWLTVTLWYEHITILVDDTITGL